MLKLHHYLFRSSTAACMVVVIASGLPSLLASLRLSAPQHKLAATVYLTDDALGRITSGPDGALWFINRGNEDRGGTEPGSIGRITTNGQVTIYRGPDIYTPADITVGPDGALWFTNFGSEVGDHPGSIGRITTNGKITVFTGTGIANPQTITSGPDRALWFTNTNNSIGRITTTGTVTDYTLPEIYDADSIVTGPDKALWFTIDGVRDEVGRMTTSGKATIYTDKRIYGPEDITVGPDGALWFVNFNSGAVGRITTSGKISVYTEANGVDLLARGITSGPDGALWFTNGNSIARMTSSGGVTAVYSNPGIANEYVGATAITTGSDGALWFTNNNWFIDGNGNATSGYANSIGRVTLGGQFSFYPVYSSQGQTGGTTPNSTPPSSTPPVTTLLGGPTYEKVPVLGHWSGFLVTGSLFSKVTGGVIVPNLTCPPRSAKDADQVVWIWAGIGGTATEGNALVQDGVRGSCASGTQKWSAVLESNPHVYTTVQTLPVTINSRDRVSFTVTVVGSQATYAVSDLTTGQHASVTQRVPTVVPEHSGECVVEAPLEPTGVVSPLPDFGTVTISGCSVTTSLGAVCPVPLGTGCPDGTTYTRVEMATSNNASTVLAKVPVPPLGAKTFHVLWDAYCNPSPECMRG